ncbi:MAG: hypothetical protein Q8936_15775 [Bacillota bacterium]|nr:hypothetical protein [Bacillota bacterium]
MIGKKVLTLVVVAVVIGGTSIFVTSHPTVAAGNQNIKLLDYKPAAKVNENGYQIDKYENIESVAWLNDSEVVTLTKKGCAPNSGGHGNIRYCSIYNLNTKKSKDFKDANICDFLGVSPDKQYVLYAEVRNIPTDQKEWQKALNSGDLLHRNIKVLNLTTGEITDLTTDKINSDAEFKWVGNNKILINYFEKWTIIDTTGKVYTQGSYNTNKKGDTPWIAGTDDIKDLGDSVEGKFYYTQWRTGKGEIKADICSMDVKTKEIKIISSNKPCGQADKKGKTIIMDTYNNNGGPSPEGIYINRTFGALIMDESGKALQDIQLPKGRIESVTSSSNYILSPDGSRAVYVESDNQIDPKGDVSESGPNVSIKVIDTKTGAVKEVVKAVSLQDKNSENDYSTIQVKDKDGTIKEKKIYRVPCISNMCWDSTSTSVSFTYGSSEIEDTNNQPNINTYVISFYK